MDEIQEKINYNGFYLFQAEALVILKNYQRLYRHRYGVEKNGVFYEITKHQYIEISRFLNRESDLSEATVEKLEGFDLDPYQDALKPKYKTEFLGNIYLAQRAEGGIYNRMIIVSPRNLRGEVNVSLINFTPDDPEFKKMLKGFKGQTLRAMKKDFFPYLKRASKFEWDRFEDKLGNLNLEAELVDKITEIVEDSFIVSVRWPGDN